jgi:hypothetical protein
MTTKTHKQENTMDALVWICENIALRCSQIAVFSEDGFIILNSGIKFEYDEQQKEHIKNALLFYNSRCREVTDA